MQSCLTRQLHHLQLDEGVILGVHTLPSGAVVVRARLPVKRRVDGVPGLKLGAFGKGVLLSVVADGASGACPDAMAYTIYMYYKFIYISGVLLKRMLTSGGLISGMLSGAVHAKLFGNAEAGTGSGTHVVRGCSGGPTGIN